MRHAIEHCSGGSKSIVGSSVAGKIFPKAAVTVLTSDSPRDENPISEPEKVSPVTGTVENAGPTFTHAFPVYSLTVLRLQTE